MNIVNSLHASFSSFSENIAISEEDSKLTYACLYQQCLKVAMYLEHRRFTHSFIAIEVDNYTNHIIAMLGILMSGNSYISITEDNKVFFSADDSLQAQLTIVSNSSISAIDTVCI